MIFYPFCCFQNHRGCVYVCVLECWNAGRKVVLAFLLEVTDTPLGEGNSSGWENMQKVA